MLDQAPSINRSMTDRINMARMICVLGMIYVHVPDGDPGTPMYGFHEGNLGFFLEGLLVEGPGRASAALLSLVSGYLAAVALLKNGGQVGSLYRRRFRSIVVPMIFWSSITYLVYLLVSQARPTFIDDADSLLDTLNILFFITEMPLGATMHLGFLRDLFICVLLSPLLLMALRRFPYTLLFLLGSFYVLEHDQSAVIILRPLVVFAFSIGIFLALRHVNMAALDDYFPLFAVLAVMSTTMIMLVNGGAIEHWVLAFADNGYDFRETILYPLVRLFGSLAIWTFIPVLLGGRIQQLVIRAIPYLFAAYCSHYLMLTLIFYGGWMPLLGTRESVFFFVWFLVAPALSMIIAWLLVKLAHSVAPTLATLITGGRVITDAKKPPVAMATRIDPITSRQADFSSASNRNPYDRNVSPLKGDFR